ncbi:helix-turn-helix domain-containing protein [Paenibacillus tyrfis]|uniref:Helix-turn-helix conjugative transposon-like domain-containing protein n=1 Tax=Paenibacillus tyrfis TaxID=1501230 RepID=A0A081P0Q9_9BACL|nr:helix-turn-helix domain-containing protein [Paenibacillus tyrfis]KEQ24282.1 hypothetical protein ET33_11405 [Paenibacillus tyrfis]
MEEKEPRKNEDAYNLEQLSIKAREGDKRSMELILQFFEEDIKNLARYIRTSKEDAEQTLKLKLIEYIINEK